MNAGSCGKCRYWEATPGKEKTAPGICHRLPPMMIMFEHQGVMWFQPETTCNDWCGEFSQRPGKKGGAS